MRPDKKKVRHHDSRKCEEVAKEKQGPKTKPKAEALTGNASDIDPVAIQNDTTEERYAKRNISTNWARYEIPSSDGEPSDEDVLTGLDFNFALSSAGGADTMFKLKSERDWDDPNLSSFTNSYFALNLYDLESAMGCIPLYEKLDFGSTPVDDPLRQRLDEKANSGSRGYSSSNSYANVDQLNEGIISKLTLKRTENFRKKPEPPSNPSPKTDEAHPPAKLAPVAKSFASSAETSQNTPQSNPKPQPTEVGDLEQWLDDFLDD